MRIGRTLAPAAAPLDLVDIFHGVEGIFSGGRAVARFENELKEYYRVPHAFLLGSGKAALTVILTALRELYPGRDEVLIPGYTCYSVAAAVVKAGLKVRACDIDPETLDFDWRCLEEEVTSQRLLCIVSTHLFGLVADVDRAKKVVAGRGVPVVEDAAQGMGGEVGGRKLGTLGDVALFSLGRGKAYSAVSGGVIIAGDDRLGEAIGRVVDTLPRETFRDGVRALCYALALWLLIKPCCYWIPRALPFLKLGETHFDPSFEVKRLGAVQAGLATGWQKKLERLREARLRNVKALIDAGIPAPSALAKGAPSLIKFPVLVRGTECRAQVIAASDDAGLGVAPVYPEAIPGIPEMRGKVLGGGCPGAELVARSLLTLPVHPLVARQDLDKVAALVATKGR